MTDTDPVRVETDGAVSIVTIDRPAARNAVNPLTARALAAAFRQFDADPAQHVAVLTGAAGTFCAGYDLKETAAGRRGHRVETGDGPMGPTRLVLSKPVIATVTVLQFLARWGDLLWPVMVVRGDTYATLPLAMQSFFGQYPRHWGDVMAFAAMATLPTLLIFVVFQRWFVRSAVSSGIKG